MIIIIYNNDYYINKYYINNDFTIKVYEDYIEFRTGRKSAERQKLVFQKNR